VIISVKMTLSVSRMILDEFNKVKFLFSNLNPVD
jgi:hypothetical protein